MQSYIKVESVELLLSGSSFFDGLAKVIDDARSSIYLQTYIFKEDEAGIMVADKLVKAAGRGVKIQLLLDGYGSKSLSNSFIQNLRKAGIQLRFFSTFLSSENVSLSRRLHHKVVVVDNEIIMVGGINIGNHYRGLDNIPAWLDFAVMIRGALAIHAANLCESLFSKTRLEIKPISANGNISVRLRRNDRLRRRNEIYNSYKSAVKRSNTDITLFASYFLPGYFFLRRLKLAARRGVKIRIVTAGKSDIFLFHQAEKFLYPYLLRNGIEVYEWQSSVMHGKLGLFDKQFLTIGSYNLNNLSRYSCIELNVDINDKPFGESAYSVLNNIIVNQCEHITWEQWKRNNGFFRRLANAIGYYVYRVIMNLIAPKD